MRVDTSLSDKSARLSWLPAQGTMLSKDVRPQNPAQYLRGSSRRCPGAGQDGGVQAIIPRQETCRNAVCALGGKRLELCSSVALPLADSIASVRRTARWF